MEGKKEKSFEKKQELIDAAMNEFSDKGYENASLNNILKEAGISKGTFYYHFENKEDLYMYMIGVLIDQKKNFFAQNISPEDFGKDLFTLLKVMIKTGLKFAKTNPSISKFSENFLKGTEREIFDKTLGKYSLEQDKLFASLVEAAYSRGELREDIPREFVKNMIGYLFTHLHQIANIIKIDDYEDAANYLLEFMKNGLAKQ